MRKCILVPTSIWYVQKLEGKKASNKSMPFGNIFKGTKEYYALCLDQIRKKKKNFLIYFPPNHRTRIIALNTRATWWTSCVGVHIQ